MSAESEVRAILIASSALLAALPAGAASIAVDQTPDENMPRPHICFSKQYDRPTFGLDNTLLSRTQGISIQVVGVDRANAIAVRELVEDALLAGGLPWTDGAGGYDPEIDLEAEILTVEWIT
jgi:phosphoglycerate dehydrogenase-like enzyme